MKWQWVSGALLVVAGCVGFVTIADDLDHVGELFAVGGILVAGLALLVDGTNLTILRRLPLHWVAVGIGIGGVAGAVLGNVPTAIGGGLVLGVFASLLLRLRRT